MCANNRFKSCGELFCFDLDEYNLDLLVGEPKNPHFCDFGIFEPVTKPQNQLFLSLETPGYLKQINKIPGTFSKNIMFANIGILAIQNFVNFRKGGHREMMKIRVKQIQKAWICISDLSKHEMGIL